jgi:transposase
MSSLEDLESLSREELLALIAELQRQVAELTASNASLRSEIAELKRRTKRQAAPFSKGTRVSNPKRPGRQPGEGTFSFR